MFCPGQYSMAACSLFSHSFSIFYILLSFSSTSFSFMCIASSLFINLHCQFLSVESSFLLVLQWYQFPLLDFCSALVFQPWVTPDHLVHPASQLCHTWFFSWIICCWGSSVNFLWLLHALTRCCMSSTSVGVCDLLPAFWSRNPCFSSMCFPFAELLLNSFQALWTTLRPYPFFLFIMLLWRL